MTRDELHKQCMSDMLHVINTLMAIVNEKDLTDDELGKIACGTKILQDVNKKQKYLNKGK